MPIKKSLNLVKPTFPRQNFPTPSKACAMQRSLLEETGLMLRGRQHRGVFTKTGWSACPQAPSAAGRKNQRGL